MKNFYKMKLLSGLIITIASSSSMAAYATYENNLWEKGTTEILSHEELDILKNEWDSQIMIYNRNAPGTLVNEITRSVNFISGERGRNCFSQPPEYIEVSVDGGKSVASNIYSSYSEVDDFFESANHVGAGGTFGKFSASASYKKSMAREVHDISDSTSAVFKISEETNALQYNGWPEIHPYPRQWLNGSEQGKVNFRNFCGDGYIDKVTAGKSLNLVIDIQSESKSVIERKGVAAEVKAAFGLFGASAGSSQMEELKKYQKDYSFFMKAYLEGSRVPVSDINLDNVYSRLVEFENEGTAYAKLISFTSQRYDPPNWGDDHATVFANVSIPLETIEGWRKHMDDQYYPKCNNASGEISGICIQTQEKYNEMETNCSNASSWDACIPVDSNICKLEGGTSCNDLINYDNTPPPPPQPTWKIIYSGTPTTKQFTLPSGVRSIKINGVVRLADYSVSESKIRECQGGPIYVTASCKVGVNSLSVQGCYDKVSHGAASQCNAVTVIADGRVRKLEVLQ
ncbi:hypothetical protein LZS94_10060 [Aliivibrio fischeri]|uniref:hypothetical protein n=1 Tax=Aliivibrio fischeri TaxID=668 RepID=UPI001F3B0E69|nr:hypothetical protein [Aliivibrio fischeri]MCE7577839.1 hypothetical protein [Aliivibrio fischeri]MCE7590227.1 hypothetical protein [Aliivibrio fischeri]